MLVVLQLTGGNDYLNTVIPYNNPLYRGQSQGGRDRRQRHDPDLDKAHGFRRTWRR